MNFPKLFAKILVIPYITWLLLLVILMPATFGWTFVTLMFSMQPFGSVWIWYNLILLIEPLFGEGASVLIATLFGGAINIAALYGIGYGLGIITKIISRNAR